MLHQPHQSLGLGYRFPFLIKSTTSIHIPHYNLNHSPVHMMDTVIYNNMQLKANAMHRKYAHQYEYPQSGPEEANENMSDIQAESTDTASDMSSD